MLELEIRLRDHCQKIRIHTQLSGAHIIFPQEQGLAIRIYYHPPTPNTDDNSTMEDPDGILNFCYTFQWSMVLFVLPDIFATEPNEMHQFMQESMQLLDQPIPTNVTNQKYHHSRPPRFLVVSNTEQAIAAIMECADAITPSRCALRAKYIENVRHEHYVPNDIDYQSSTDTEHTSATLPVDANINEKAVAEHYGKAVREWCDRANVPDGEADVILHVLPTLHQLVHAVTDNHANNSNGLNSVPIEENTKRKLRYFFTARDGDDYNTDGHDGATNIEHVDTSDFGNVTSPPSFDSVAYNRSMLRDKHSQIAANPSLVEPNQYNYRPPQHGDRPYVLTQDGMDVDAFPVPARTAQQLNHPQSSKFIRPPLARHDGNFHPPPPHDPSPYHSHNNGGMHYAANVVDPSAHQHFGDMTESAAFPQMTQHHPPYMASFPYSGQPSSSMPQQSSHYMYHHNPWQDTETLAKVVPWGQSPPAPSHHRHHYPGMYTPHLKLHTNNMYLAPPTFSLPVHMHQPPPNSRRVSLTSYPLAPSLSNRRHHQLPQQQQQQRPFPTTATTSTVIPYDGGNHHPDPHRRHEENSLKKVVRRFM